MDPLATSIHRALAVDWLLLPSKATPTAALELPGDGLRGDSPLAWWAAGPYAGGLRQRLLQLRQRPDRQGIADLVEGLCGALHQAFGDHRHRRPVLVAVPSWKRVGNPLPSLLSGCLARQLGWQQQQLLRRSRPVLGQHHLGRELRWANQAGAFCSVPLERPPWGPTPPVVLVDDILTTGATAVAAASALQSAGWRPLGMACLARTPWQGRDLRSASRSGDGPG